jgi:hypothetical protein
MRVRATNFIKYPCFRLTHKHISQERRPNKTTNPSINSICHLSIKHPEQNHSSSPFHFNELTIKHYSTATATMSTNTPTHQSNDVTQELLEPLEGLAMDGHEEKLFNALDALWNDGLAGQVERSRNTNGVTESSSSTSATAETGEPKCKRKNKTKAKKAKKAKVGSAVPK